MRYEQALEEINEAARTGIITEREQAQMLDQVAVAYLSAGQAAGAHSGQMGMLGNVSAETSARLQNAGFQVQDVAVQIMGGTDAARALSMQLPQLLSGFGLLGVAAAYGRAGCQQACQKKCRAEAGYELSRSGYDLSIP